MGERRNPDGSLSVGCLEDMDIKVSKKEKKPIKDEDIVIDFIEDDVIIEKPVLEEPVKQPARKGRPRKK